MNANPDNFSILIKASTWLKETNDLYDFDTKDIASTETKTTSNTYIVSNANKIEFLKKKGDISKNVIKEKNKFKIIAEVSPSQSKLLVIQMEGIK